MISKVLLSVVLLHYVSGEQIDFCTFALSNNLNGVAYTIVRSIDGRGEQFQDAFEENVRTDHVTNQFKHVFGESIDTVKSFNWFYNFNTLGRINISDILPSSLHCVYMYDRELFTERYDQETLTAEGAIKFVLNEVIYQVARETPTNVRLPLLEVTDREAVGCNFAKISTAIEQYFLVHCIHDDWSGKALKSTKIIEKSTRKEICVSDIPSVCEENDNKPENVVDVSVTLDLTDENELKKMISSMNCINCTININVQPKP